MLARRIDELEFRFEKALDRHLNYQRDTLAAAAARLNSLSPLGVLARGYSMTHRSDETQLITSADQVAEGELIVSRLASGELVSRVEQVRPGDDQDQPFQQTEKGNEP
jgi:exodeoxyribonuclease VII large subunit